MTLTIEGLFKTLSGKNKVKNQFAFRILVVRMLAIVLFSSTIQFRLPAQRLKIDSLLSVLNLPSDDSTRIPRLNELSWELVNTGNCDSAFYYASAAKELCEKAVLKTARVKSWLANSYNIFGVIHSVRGNLAEALKNYNTSLMLRREAGNIKGMALSHNNIGKIHKSLGNYNEALKNYFLSLKIAGQLGNKQVEADVYNNIGNVYCSQKDYPKALKNYAASLKLNRETGNTRGVADVLNNIGVIYSNQADFKNALLNYEASLELYKTLSNKQGVAGSYENIGQVYANQAMYAEALNSHMASLKIREEIQDRQGVAGSLGSIGMIRICTGDVTDARKCLQKALALSLETGDKELAALCYKGLLQADSASGNYKTALSNYKMYILYRDSLQNENSTKEQVRLEMQYEFDRKESEAKVIQAKKDVEANEQKRRQKIVLWSVVSGLLLVLAFAAFVLRAFKQKQRSNIEISAQKNIIELKQKEILDSIYYARRIQSALITSENYIAKRLRKLNNPGN